MLEFIFSNPKNIYWALPVFLIILILVYTIPYSIVCFLLNSDLEGQREYMAKEYNINPMLIDDELLEQAIEATAAWWGNVFLISFSVLTIISTIIAS